MCNFADNYKKMYMKIAVLELFSVKNVLRIFVFVVSLNAFAQNYTISGYLKDSISKEILIGGTIYDTVSNQGITSNSYGFYSFTLPKGNVNLEYSYVGYLVETRNFVLDKDTVINIDFRQGNTLQEVSVAATRSDIGVKGSQMSAIEVPIAQIKSIPAFLGEVDLIKALQLLPGVQGGTEGTAGFYVRGGGPDENLILLDEIPVYNVNHAMGFFSIFNADAIKNVVLYKGSFPARYGERLSSVIDIRTKDGDAYKYHGNFSLGLIASKLNLEGPIIKDKTTFSISGRRTYFDLLTAPLVKSATNGQSLGGYYFYDLNAKINHKFSDKDRLYLSFYMGDDGIYTLLKESSFKTNMTMKWGNMITSLRWNHVLNNKLFMNITGAFSRYRFSMRFEAKDETNIASASYNSGITDGILKADFDYSLNPRNSVKFGTMYIIHKFSPEVITAKSSDTPENDMVFSNKPIITNEISAYVEDNTTITNYLKVNAGIRYSAFALSNKYYHSLQPRLSARLLITDDLSLKAGYSYMSQYIHLLANSTMNMPTDLWVPSTEKIAPINTHQVALGVFYNLKKQMDFSIEGYYKTMNNIVEYKDGASFFGISKDWQEKVNMGKGWAYGVEFMVQKNVGKFTGWVGYTWAKSMRQFDRYGQEINFGKPFPAKFDRRHDLKITVAYKISDRIDLAGSWLFATGNATTLALHSYSGLVRGNYNSERLPYISSRNNYRMPSFHRLDLGINFNKKTKLGGISTWNISIYNVYNNQNPFILYTEENYNSKGKKLKQLSLFPIIPSVSYSYKF